MTPPPALAPPPARNRRRLGLWFWRGCRFWCGCRFWLGRGLCLRLGHRLAPEVRPALGRAPHGPRPRRQGRHPQAPAREVTSSVWSPGTLSQAIRGRRSVRRPCLTAQSGPAPAVAPGSATVMIMGRWDRLAVACLGAGVCQAGAVGLRLRGCAAFGRVPAFRPARSRRFTSGIGTLTVRAAGLQA